MKKVALLFLLVDDHWHKDLWQELLTPLLDRFNIYVHPKKTLKSIFFRQYIIADNVPTSWQSNIRAMRVLLKAAYQNRDNYKFVYLSDSCVPLYPLTHIYDKLVVDDSSYMSHRPPWWRHQQRIPSSIPSQHHWGASQWTILNRGHANIILQDNTYFDVIAGRFADNESYPATLFKSLGLLHQFHRGLTYVDWSRRPNGPGHPFTYRNINQLSILEWRKARQRGCYFIRKVAASVPRDHVKRLIYMK
jgi:hypothetical protein